MKAILSILIGLVSFFSASSKDDPKYPVNEIPAELLKDVNAVVRQDRMLYTIISDGRAVLKATFAVTILNAKAKHFAEMTQEYSKLVKISSFEGKAFDANGDLIKKLKSSEIYDQSAVGGSTLYSDNRLKSADLSQSSYPYTIEFEYEIEYKFLYHIEGSTIIPGEKVAVQKASYQLVYPPSLAPRFKTYNISQEPKREKLSNGNESISWFFENLKPMKFEPNGPNAYELVPRIVAAPSKFDYDGYPGNMSSWDEYARWQLSLNKGKDVLPEEAKLKVKELTNGVKSTEGKVKVLYEYVQNTTRYVNISLGIGGLQPFDAATVNKTGYGDCKALSNYMVSLLKEIGIKGYYTKIMAGDGAPEIDRDFPSHQTNHIIVGVPNNADTIWLECTNQNNPFNYLGSFTGDRKAFMVTENGGSLVYTHRYTAEQNVQSRTAYVILEAAGDAKAKVKTTYSGIQYENDHLNFFLSDQFDEQKKWIQRNTQIPIFDINSFDMKNKKERIPSAIVNLDLTLKRYATVSGKRIFVTPNLMNRSTFIPEKVENRKTKVVTRSAYTDLDTIHYHLPEGIYPEFLPEPVTIKSRFGEYEARFTVDDKGLTYIRRVRMNKGEFPAESYTELIDFYRSMNKADNTKLVFMNKT